MSFTLGNIYYNILSVLPGVILWLLRFAWIFGVFLAVALVFYTTLRMIDFCCCCFPKKFADFGAVSATLSLAVMVVVWFMGPGTILRILGFLSWLVIGTPMPEL